MFDLYGTRSTRVNVLESSHVLLDVLIVLRALVVSQVVLKFDYMVLIVEAVAFEPALFIFWRLLRTLVFWQLERLSGL